MSTNAASHNNRVRIVFLVGAVFLLVGLALHWNAKQLARQSVSVNVTTVDKVQKETVHRIADNLYWTGLALVGIGSFVWVSQTEETRGD